MKKWGFGRGKKCSNISPLWGNDRASPVARCSEGAPPCSTTVLLTVSLLQTPEPHLLGALVP